MGCLRKGVALWATPSHGYEPPRGGGGGAEYVLLSMQRNPMS